MAQKDKWLEPEGLNQITEWKSHGLTNEQIAENMGISVSTLYEWKNTKSEISEAYKKGYANQVAVVESAAMKTMTGYDVWEETWERISDDRQKKRHSGDVALTQKEWEFCLKYFGYRCCYCDESISGIDPKSKRSKATKDHIVPLEKGGKMDRFNIVPACQKCNSAKNINDMKTWYKKQKFYQEYRLKKIDDYINLMKSTEGDSEPELVLTKKVKKHIPPNSTMIIFFLKNRYPEIYSEWIKQKEYEKENAIEGEATETNVLVLPDINIDLEPPKEEEE